MERDPCHYSSVRRSRRLLTVIELNYVDEFYEIMEQARAVVSIADKKNVYKQFKQLNKRMRGDNRVKPDFYIYEDIKHITRVLRREIYPAIFSWLF